MVAGADEPVVGAADEVELASPDSLVGLVQRGHGRGFLWASEEPALGRAAVVRSVVDDPRWDQQVEDRAWCNAALVDALGVEPEAVRAGLEHDLDPGTGQDTGAWMAVGTLTVCARRGVPRAVDELRRYLRTGRDLELILPRLVELHALGGTEWLRDEILDVADPGALVDALTWTSGLDGAPWSSWRRQRSEWARVLADVAELRRRPPPAARAAHVHRLANMWNLVGPEQREPRLGERGETVVELLAGADAAPTSARSFGEALADRRETGARAQILAAARAGGDGAKAAALVALGRPRDDALLEFVDEADHMSGRVLRPYQHALRRLSSPAALRWARSAAGSSGALAAAAVSVLAAHGAPGDVVQLRDLLAQAVDDGWIYGQCDLVEGLHRLSDNASVAAVEDVYRTTGYSYLRRRCVHALADLSPTFGHDQAIECLWDCEAASRLIAVAHAPPVPAVRRRLMAMAVDPTEDDSVVVAARARG